MPGVGGLEVKSRTSLKCSISVLEFSKGLYLCNHLSESIHSWTKGTLPLPHPTPSHPTPTLPLPHPYPTLPQPIPSPTLTYPNLPCPTLPYATPTQSNPTLPLPYPLRIQTHAHNQASRSRATLSCDSSYLSF